MILIPLQIHVESLGARMKSRFQGKFLGVPNSGYRRDLAMMSPKDSVVYKGLSGTMVGPEDKGKVSRISGSKK